MIDDLETVVSELHKKVVLPLEKKIQDNIEAENFYLINLNRTIVLIGEDAENVYCRIPKSSNLIKYVRLKNERDLDNLSFEDKYESIKIEIDKFIGNVN